MIDAGWRVYRGEVPGRDFIVTFPASLYMLVALSYKVLGVSWRSIAIGGYALYLVLVASGLRLGALIDKSRGTTAAIGLVSVFATFQTVLLVSINYPWHASMAEALAAYAVLAVFAVISSHSTSESSGYYEGLCHLALALGLLLLSKPNTAYPTVILCVIVLWRAAIPRAHVALVVAACISITTLALNVVHVSPIHMVSAYVGLTGRFIPRAFINGILYQPYARYGLANLLVYAILAPALGLTANFIWRHRLEIRLSPELLLAAGSIVIAVIGMGTNFDFKLTDTPLATLGLAILAFGGGKHQVVALRLRVAVATASLLFVALYIGKTRFRMQIVGNWADDKASTPQRIQDQFFGDFLGSTQMAGTLQEVDTTLKMIPARHVFFGSGLEFLYAVHSLPSPPQLPNWWDPGSSFPIRKTSAIATAWEADSFDLLVFQRGDSLEQLPEKVRQDIRRRYVAIPGTAFTQAYRPR